MLVAVSAQATLIEFSFYDSPDFNGNVVGTATLGFDDTLADGSYTLDSLTNISFDANFDSGDTFNFTDFEDSQANVLAILTSAGAAQMFNFGNVNGDSGGQSSGSADFVSSGGNILTFEPGTSGGIAYAIYDPNSFDETYFGFYKAIVKSSQVPEPSTMAILILGLAGLVLRKK